jgi:sugar-specific transcriptional regulator TrmB
MTAGHPVPDLIEALRELGLSAYDACVFAALQQSNPANGNQISRQSGVPSPKVYASLQRLLERGLVTSSSTRPVTYVPLPIDEFLHEREARIREVSATIRQRLRTGFSPAHREMLWHSQGYEALLDRARRIMAEARREVFISAWREQVRDLLPALRAARRRRVRVVAMLFDAPGLEIGFTIHHVMLRTVYERHGDQMLLTGDDTSGLLMDRSRGSWGGIWTSNPAVIRVIRNYIRHDLYVNKLYHRFPELLQATYGRELDLLLDVTGDRVLPGAPAPPRPPGRLDRTRRRVPVPKR